MKKHLYTSILLLTLVSCNIPTIEGIWKIDETRLKKDNPSIDGFTLDMAKTLFYLVEFNKETITFLMYDYTEKYSIKKDKEYFVHTSKGDIYVTQTNKKRLKIKLIDKSSDKEKIFVFYMDKQPKNKHNINPKTNKIYKSHNDNGMSSFVLFTEDKKIYILDAETTENITSELIKAEEINLDGSWSRTSGEYVALGNEIYLISTFDITKIKLISENEFILNDKHYFIE